MSDQDWFTVAVQTTEATVDLVVDLLWGFSPPAVEERAGPEGLLVLTGFHGRALADRAAATVTASGWGTARVSRVTDDGLDGWRAWASVERAGPFVLAPSWLPTPEIAPGEVLLQLDPGPTFGSGSHPTTRLVLAELADLLSHRTSDDGLSTVLDVGCGSGVLAVGAALAGATGVDAIDIDRASPPVTTANADRNGVAHLVEASNQPLTVLSAEVRSGRRPYDVVVANLLAPVIVDLANDLVDVLAPTGHLVVSGLLADRWHEAVASFDASPGLVNRRVTENQGWVAVTLSAGDPADEPAP